MRPSLIPPSAMRPVTMVTNESTPATLALKRGEVSPAHADPTTRFISFLPSECPRPYGRAFRTVHALAAQLETSRAHSDSAAPSEESVCDRGPIRGNEARVGGMNDDRTRERGRRYLRPGRQP